MEGNGSVNMKRRIFVAALITGFLASTALAGLDDGIEAYQAGN